jgi:hypothetical protein
MSSSETHLKGDMNSCVIEVIYGHDKMWSANFGRLLVVYHRIVQISRLNLACAVPSPTRMTSTTFESRYGSSLGPGKYQILALAVPLRVNVCVVVNVV